MPDPRQIRTWWRGRDVTLRIIASETDIALSTLKKRYKAGDRGEQLSRAAPTTQRTFHGEHENGDGI